VARYFEEGLGLLDDLLAAVGDQEGVAAGPFTLVGGDELAVLEGHPHALGARGQRAGVLQLALDHERLDQGAHRGHVFGAGHGALFAASRAVNRQIAHDISSRWTRRLHQGRAITGVPDNAVLGYLARMTNTAAK